MIYVTDVLGNSVISYLDIYNLDNTKPTITSVSSDIDGMSVSISIEGNDRDTLLNSEGSGVAGYALTQSDAEPEESSFQESNSFVITQPGTWYAWIIDTAGNISDPEPIGFSAVRFDPCSGSAVSSTIYGFNDTYGALEEPGRIGFTFDGWYTQKEGVEKIIPDSDIPD